MLPIEDQTVACRCAMFDNFAVLVTPSINRVVEFAKRIPGSYSFCDISCDSIASRLISFYLCLLLIALVFRPYALQWRLLRSCSTTMTLAWKQAELICWSDR